MARNRITRIAAVALLAITMALAAARSAPALGELLSSGPPMPPGSVQRPRTAGQQELIEWANRRFSANGLGLPPIDIEFSPSSFDCDGHRGLYYAAQRRLHMCSMDQGTMLHELAHAWAHGSLSDADRQHFVELRGLGHWDDRSDPWKERGTEHAAETIAWGLMYEPTHVRWVEDGVESFVLLTIPNSDVDSLAVAFETLTGFDSP